MLTTNGVGFTWWLYRDPQMVDSYGTLYQAADGTWLTKAPRPLDDQLLLPRDLRRRRSRRGPGRPGRRAPPHGPQSRAADARAEASSPIFKESFMRIRGLSILLSCLALAACQGLPPRPRTAGRRAAAACEHRRLASRGRCRPRVHLPRDGDRRLAGRPRRQPGSVEDAGRRPRRRHRCRPSGAGRVRRPDALPQLGAQPVLGDARRRGQGRVRPGGRCALRRAAARSSHSAGGSTVWLENESTHEVVVRKFVAGPATAASAPDMRSRSNSRGQANAR